MGGVSAEPELASGDDDELCMPLLLLQAAHVRIDAM
jgi:hypothetical protein